MSHETKDIFCSCMKFFWTKNPINEILREENQKFDEGRNSIKLKGSVIIKVKEFYIVMQ